MDKSIEVKLVEKIIEIDLLRDQLYEELIQILGPRTDELIRKIQNNY
ncbi:hypothetical protein [Peribacillus saganii]|nr:hypothetical protein [Peribacillus saganii]